MGSGGRIRRRARSRRSWLSIESALGLLVGIRFFRCSAALWELDSIVAVLHWRVCCALSRRQSQLPREFPNFQVQVAPLLCPTSDRMDRKTVDYSLYYVVSAVPARSRECAHRAHRRLADFCFRIPAWTTTLIFSRLVREESRSCSSGRRTSARSSLSNWRRGARKLPIKCVHR